MTFCFVFELHLRTALSRFFGLSERAPRFMSQRDADRIYNAGMEFLKKHLELSRVAIRPEGTTLVTRA